MSRYTTPRLRVDISIEDFRRSLDGFLSLDDHAMEGYADAERQRDLSVRFHWGHDHDFGPFALKGRMGDHHLRLIETYVSMGALPADLAGQRVLDIGCWTGGTSLLLAAMGAAEVHAVEEVRKYADAANYLAHAFAVDDRLTVHNRSLFECTTPELQDRFDIVNYSGVLYHVSDPILSLRICFNALRDGGTCLVETESLPGKQLPGLDLLRYLGPRHTHSGTPAERSRGGWNWFIPSAPTVRRMMEDVGFTDVVCHGMTVAGDHGQRMFAVGTRQAHVDMLRAGLSAPKIR
jgi:2-polyprenyl-3-methyl-5-hydroxy-6-metoxy-1,4-benzoquinol methylase